MIKLKSEGHFEAALTNARLKLTLLSRHDLDLETKLEAFAKEKETYSQFCVDKVKGTHGLHVSSVSEQNHASTLCHLNDNHSKNNKYCEQHITLVKDLFACQQCHVNITKSLP